MKGRRGVALRKPSWVTIQRAYRAYRARRGRRPRTRMTRSRTRVRTGYLPMVQKDLTESFQIPAGPYPNGYIKQFKFSIENIQNLAEVTRLFDQYRIRAVSVRLMPQSNTNDTVNPSMTFCSSIDLDGGGVANFDALIACSNAKTSNWSSAGGNIAGKTIYLKPRFRNVHVVDPTTVPVTYGQNIGRKNAWLDLADGGTTDHFGLNVGFLPGSATATLGFAVWVNVIITYYIEFRKIR